MTSKESAELDRRLAEHRCTYDPTTGEFHASGRRLEWEHLLGLLPGLSFDDLMAYEAVKHDEWRRGLSPRR